MLRRFTALLLASATLAACSSSSSNGDSGDSSQGSGGQGSGGAASTGSSTSGPATTGSGGGGGEAASCQPTYDDKAIHLAVGLSLNPGEDTNRCLRWTAPEDIDVTGLVGALGATGHHSLLLGRANSKDPDGVAPCNEAELMDAPTSGDFQMLAGVSYESSGVEYDFPTAPVQVGLRVVKGTQLIFDAHFLNAGTAPQDGCATLDLKRGAPVVVPLVFYTVLPKDEYALSIPAHGTLDVDYTDPAPGKYRIAAASSHMHQGATHFRLSIKETDQTVYESTNWADPQPSIFATQTFVVEEGQTFRLQCSFENDTAAPIGFPNQMCVGGMYLLSCAFPGAC